MNRWGYDETRGTIIGGDAVKYEFWQKDADFDWRNLIAREYFENDEDALAWLQENHPGEWARRAKDPIEMRVFDQPGKREQEMLDIRRVRL